MKKNKISNNAMLLHHVMMCQEVYVAGLLCLVVRVAMNTGCILELLILFLTRGASKFRKVFISDSTANKVSNKIIATSMNKHIMNSTKHC